MQKNNRNSKTYLGIFCCLLSFVLLRWFQEHLFYDPLVAYFKGEFTQQSFPDVIIWKLLLSNAFRFVLNAIISITLIYFIFKDRNIIKFSVILFATAFVILITSFACIVTYGSKDYFLLFTLRRFIIHPILVLLFIPAFFYQKSVQK